jgi:predicted O-methyltransferase YrrM
MGMDLIEERVYGTEYTGGTDEPWLTRGAITFLDEVLTKDMTALEFGCGTSTAWYAKRVKHLTSIDDSSAWIDRVREYLQSKDVTNVDLQHLSLIEAYFEAVDDMGNFDFVSIDGRRRCECIWHSHSHIRKDGYLLLDNADRKRYQWVIRDYLNGWERVDFNNGIWLTSIFKR